MWACAGRGANGRNARQGSRWCRARRGGCRWRRQPEDKTRSSGRSGGSAGRSWRGRSCASFGVFEGRRGVAAGQGAANCGSIEEGWEPAAAAAARWSGHDVVSERRRRRERARAWGSSRDVGAAPSDFVSTTTCSRAHGGAEYLSSTGAHDPFMLRVSSSPRRARAREGDGALCRRASAFGTSGRREWRYLPTGDSETRRASVV